MQATSALIEGRYTILPGLYAAARLDHLGFSDITGSTGTREWDAPVTRVMVFPRADVTIIPTWDVIGMSGTGSHDYAVSDLFVEVKFNPAYTLRIGRYKTPVSGLENLQPSGAIRFRNRIGSLRIGYWWNPSCKATAIRSTGKTTLLRTVVRNLDAQTTVAYIFNPALSALELLQTINADLGLLVAGPRLQCSAKGQDGHQCYGRLVHGHTPLAQRL